MNVGSKSSEVNNLITPHWEGLYKETKHIKIFLESLDASKIGTGLVRVNEQQGLEPRSNYLNNRIVQYISTIGDKTANYESTKECFKEIKVKIEYLLKQIWIIEPSSVEYCTYEDQLFFYKLRGLELIITKTAREGLEQLSKNYSNKGETDKSATLAKEGNDLFAEINTATQTLREKLIAHIPTLEKGIGSERLSLSARKLILKKDRYCKDLRAVAWTPENGTRIPYNMLLESNKDIKKVAKFFGTEAIKNVVNALELPAKAHSIPSQNGSAEWIPVRPKDRYKEGQYEIYFEKGVFGTCEETFNSHLCNFYSKQDPHTKNITISTGAINTELRGSEIIVLLKKLTKDYQHPASHWVVHQLDPYTTDGKLFIDTQAQVKKINFFMQEGDKDFCLMHINTPFNIGPTHLDENLIASTINIESLIQIAYIARKEIYSMLEKTHFNFENQAWKEFDRSCGLLLQPNALKEVRLKIQLLIAALVSLREMTTQSVHYYDKVLLILRTLEPLLAHQLKLDGAPSLTSTGKIELYLLLYRFLGIQVIISCEDGTDRTAAVAAIDDSLSLLEQELFQKHLNQVIGKKEAGNQKEMEFTARINAHTTLLDLILTLDVNRTTLFQLANQAKQSIGYYALLPEEKTLIPSVKVSGFRQNIIEQINSNAKAEMLRNTLYYLEIFASHLLGTQQEKIFNSSGIFGFKYYYESGWVISAQTANSYPLDRLPPFIFTEDNDIIQLLAYLEVGSNFMLTPLGEALIFRSSKGR